LFVGFDVGDLVHDLTFGFCVTLRVTVPDTGCDVQVLELPEVT